jgi:hypothetical protein
MTEVKVTVFEGQDLADLKQNLEQECFGHTEPGHCVQCKEPFSGDNTFTDAGWRETKISKMCERCFDALFENEED